MSDELRVRQFLEQVEEVEKLMNAKQQVGLDALWLRNSLSQDTRVGLSDGPSLVHDILFC